MQITKLYAENILRLQAVNITPNSPIIEIKGDNASGKSSILDAIVIGLRGKKATPLEPVKHGEKKGKIVIEMDGDESLGISKFTITSKVTNNKIETVIEPAELLNGETPRQFLDKLLGAISFDPWEFINQDGKKQKQVLLELIGVDVDEIDRREKKIFDDRTIKGRELKAAEIKFKELRYFTDITETEEVKVSELSKKLTDAMAFNSDYLQREENNNALKESVIAAREEIKTLRARADEMESKANQQKEIFLLEKAALAKLKPIDVQAINQEIATVEEKNSKIRANKKYAEEKLALSEVEAEYKNLDTSLEDVRQEKVAALQSANIPVDNLTFAEDGLLYNNIPISQCSDGEKLMISMRISMALNPTVKILRVKDGSLIGPKNLEILKEMVRDKGYQLWMEEVMGRDEYESGGKVGIFIEEGIAEGPEELVKKEVGRSKVNKGKKESKKEVGGKEDTKEEVQETTKQQPAYSTDNVTVTNTNDDDDW